MNTRFQNCLFVLLLCAATHTVAAAEVKLAGIFCYNGTKYALLEVGPHSSRNSFLKAGERFEGVEVKSIDEKAARVTVLDGDRTLDLPLDGQEGVANQTFNFKSADSTRVLDAYQEVTGRTVLPSPSLVRSRIDLKTAAGLSAVEAETALAGALREKGTVMVMRYDKFAFAVPFSYVPRLDSLRTPPAPPKSDDKEEMFPAGLIKFQEADAWQVLEVYQELSGQTLIYGPDVPPAKITVRSQTQLARSEAMWALETLLRLGGITLAPDGKFVSVLRTAREAGAPMMASNAALATRRDEPLPAGSFKFAEARGGEVLQAYAKLIGRTAVLEEMPACQFKFRSQTSLTPSEAVYALDLAAALNHVRFVVTDKEVRLVPAAGPKKENAP